MTQGQGGGTPAGWYPDPEGNGERWWNGMSWGELRAPSPAQQQPYPPQNHDPYQSQQPHQPQQGQAYGQHTEQTPEQSQPAQQTAAPGMRCVHCQFTDFTQANFLLNTRGMTFFELDAFNAGANCLICRRCGFIHWFATR